MRNLLKIPKLLSLMLLFLSATFIACDNEEDDMQPDEMDDTVELSGESKVYNLNALNESGVSGTATLEETEEGSTLLTLELSGTPAGGEHPAHIHFNSAAIGGGIAISLEPVDGDTGLSETLIEVDDDGAPITFTELLDFDGYINIHLSADELETVVAQGDIGSNELTGESKTYNLGERAVEGILGTITFEERINGFALATISLDGTPEEGEHPAHIHENSAAIGGGIIYSFNLINGSTGISMTDTRDDGDGNTFTYSEILEVDGYVNVHLSADDLGTIVAQGDIGVNELTGESKTYDLGERAVEGISGTITFEERINGFALATISLDGTPEGGEHPAHIHENSAAIGGGIIYSFNPINGSTGISMTDTRDDGDGNTFTYSEVLEVDGYVNVHLSADDLGTIVAQGDIGVNELTGESITYPLAERAVEGISGSITFEERVNGFALATISLDGTPDGGEHPAHIHENSASEGGGIIYTFNSVNGTTGISMTDTRDDGDGNTFTYSEVLEVNGYVNVHLSADDLGTIVAQGDIGANFTE
ncbi:CHRD domain-containing protein [Marivirga sp.]|uniref:CHRD domain-containing protein n=1 Tax=Marivirga sp. TaxID=2018662 RepID=UPI003DA75E86